MLDRTTTLSDFPLEFAGNRCFCPVCADEGIVRDRFNGDLIWDACWLCAQRAEIEYQIDVVRCAV